MLFRYQYDAASQRWLIVGQQVGAGWSIYDRVLSSGGDVLYGITSAGDMYWYRWNVNTNSWISNVGRWISNGWLDWATTATPNACTLIGTTTPTRPVVPARPNGPAVLRYTTNNDVHYAYVDSEGRVVHASGIDVGGGSSFGFNVVPGFTGVTGSPALAEQQDGRVQLAAGGTDADVRGDLQTTVRGPWSGTSNLGGFLAGQPNLVRLADNTLMMFALDQTYGLWARRQSSPNAPFEAWIPIGGTTLAHRPLTLVPTGDGVRIIGLGRDDSLQTAVYANQLLSSWSGLGGTGFTGAASAVVMPDGTLQVFANRGGTVHTQRQISTGFPGAWTALPGLTVLGSPSAIMSPSGTLQIVARGDDGYVYYASQLAPGATGYTPWLEITNYAEQTSTEPTALAVPDENTWVVGYISDIGVPKLRRYQASGPARTTHAGFTDVPVIPSAE